MQAALETMKWPVPNPEFCTRENGVPMGERTERKRGTINHEHGFLLCAHDAVFFFNTREDLLNVSKRKKKVRDPIWPLGAGAG
jgi:hypothetical protein